MGKIPNELRETIANNIRTCRAKKFPGRGGGKKCAEAFTQYLRDKGILGLHGRPANVSPQQWSPWERGMRTPDEIRLQQIAEFFNVTVEDLRRDTRTPPASPPPMAEPPPPFGIGGPIPGLDVAPLPGWQPDPPGSPASFFWLARHYDSMLQTHGFRIDRQSLEYLAAKIRNLP